MNEDIRKEEFPSFQRYELKGHLQLLLILLNALLEQTVAEQENITEMITAQSSTLHQKISFRADMENYCSSAENAKKEEILPFSLRNCSASSTRLKSRLHFRERKLKNCKFSFNY